MELEELRTQANVELVNSFFRLREATTHFNPRRPFEAPKGGRGPTWLEQKFLAKGRIEILSQLFPDLPAFEELRKG